MWPDSSCLSCGSALVQVVADWCDIVQRCFSGGFAVSGRCCYLVKLFISCGSAVLTKLSFVCGAALDCFWVCGSDLVQVWCSCIWHQCGAALSQLWFRFGAVWCGKVLHNADMVQQVQLRFRCGEICSWLQLVKVWFIL